MDVLVIESDDVVNALAEEIAKHGINNLVIGASYHGLFSRYLLPMVYILSTISLLFIRKDGNILLILTSLSF